MSTIQDAIWRTLDFLRMRKKAYQLSFTSPAGQEVLHDLAKFCRANESTFHPDPRIEGRLDGRREVWLRIQQHLNLTSEELYDLYAGRSLKPKLENKK